MVPLNKFSKSQLPVGVRDLLPYEAREKRYLENQFIGLVEGWGYQEVVTPTFELYNVISSQEDDDKVFKFLDRKGHLLALRSDMTTPIARLAASRLKDEILPLRLHYLSNVFSFEEPQVGRQRETYQAGIELIGTNLPESDAEVIALAIESIKRSGLEYFQISLGQIDVFNGLMEDMGLSDEVIRLVKHTIGNRDFVGLEELLEENHISQENRDSIIKLTMLHGGREVIEVAKSLCKNPKAIKALENLSEVYEVIEDYGLVDKISIDLGLLRGFDYYTGIVFEGYTSTVGAPICGGGRYDGLLGQFGWDVPATGFALDIDRILLALARQEISFQTYQVDYLVVYEEFNKKEMVNKARELRSQGFKVITFSKNQYNLLKGKEINLAKNIIEI